ncbi:MAG: polysaccharide deacetylase family protein [Minisyncoccota bacterium]
MRKTTLTIILSGTILVALGTILYASPYHFDKKLPRGFLGQASLQEVAPEATSTKSVRIPIFIYHSVLPDHPSETPIQKEYTITPELFEQQLIYLRDHGYTTISLDELVRDIKMGTTSPTIKPVVLTFDDGWRNQYYYAFPLLKKYHATATFFVYTNPISRSPNFLTWDELREMQSAGMTFGDHTLSHPYLSRLTAEEIHAEVLGGKKVLEEHLGIPITHFASPFGYTDPALESFLKEKGFSFSRTTYVGSQHAERDLFHATGFLVHRTIHDFIWALQYAP